MLMLERTESAERADHRLRRGGAAAARGPRVPPPPRREPGASASMTSITDVPGVRAANLTLDGTGVTVVVFPEGTAGSCEVRGGAPASRETALLEPTKLVEHVDAIVLTGGSAFGLATADGVMDVLAAEGRGFRVERRPGADRPDRRDLRSGRVGGVRPGAADGAHAAELALAGGALELGRVGAGRGATVGKWRGAPHERPGGLGSASASARPVHGRRARWWSTRSAT